MLETKIKAIDNCKEAGLPVVLVPTVAPGVNDHALGDILRFALSRAPHVRGVYGSQLHEEVVVMAVKALYPQMEVCVSACPAEVTQRPAYLVKRHIIQESK